MGTLVEAIIGTLGKLRTKRRTLFIEGIDHLLAAEFLPVTSFLDLISRLSEVVPLDRPC